MIRVVTVGVKQVTQRDRFCTNDRCSQVVKTGKPRFIGTGTGRRQCSKCGAWSEDRVTVAV